MQRKDSASKKIIIISGPTGSGQDAVIERLRTKIPFTKVVTTTSRPKREREKEGRDYYFVSKKVFEEKIRSGEMFEWKKVYEDYKGISNAAFEKVMKTKQPVLLKLDWKGTSTIKKEYPDSLSIGLKPESIAVLHERLRKRQKDGESVLKERLEGVKDWMKKHFDVYDVVVVNHEGKLSQTVKKIQKIIEQYLKQ